MLLIAMIALYLLFLPLFYCPVVSTTAAGAPVIDYIIDDRTPLLSSYQASRATPPLPHIAYCSIFICCTRHMLLLRYNPILLHSLSLSPLDYFPISYAALYIYILQQWTLRFASHRLASGP